MKRLHCLSIFAALGLLAPSCSIKEDRIKCVAPVTVHLNNFSVSQEEFPETKSDPVDPATYDGVNAITLAFYTSDGTERYKTTQLKTDPTSFTTFGEFELSLPMDSYTMVAIAHTTKDGSPFTLTSPISASYTGDHAYETYVATQAVNITSTSAIELEATLDRIYSLLQVRSTDGKTANAAGIRMTLSAGGKSFSPATGLATVNTGFSNTVSISTAIGTASRSNTVLFLASDEQTMNVTIDVLDEDGNSISHKVVNNVPFKRNRMTKLTGAIYTTDAAASFLLSTDWLADTEILF